MRLAALALEESTQNEIWKDSTIPKMDLDWPILNFPLSNQKCKQNVYGGKIQKFKISLAFLIERK